MKNFFCTCQRYSVQEEWEGQWAGHTQGRGILTRSLSPSDWKSLRRCPGAPPTSKSLLWGHSQVLGVYVCLVVLRQVVAPHETLLTLVALEAFVSCQEGGGRIQSVSRTRHWDMRWFLSQCEHLFSETEKVCKNNQQPPAVSLLFCSFSFRLP